MESSLLDITTVGQPYSIPPPSLNIISIASRIQDRANQLSLEQSNLKILHNCVKDSNNALQQESEKNSYVREELLSKTREKDAIDLDLIFQKRKIEDINKKISILRNKEITQLNKIVTGQRLEYDRVSTTVYAPHEFKIENFRRNIESKLRSRREKILKRERKLKKLLADAKRFHEEATSTNKKQQERNDAIQVLDDMEVKEDEEITALAMQIRATLTKRMSLRSALQHAKERNNEVNQNMLKWEQECVQLSTNK